MFFQRLSYSARTAPSEQTLKSMILSDKIQNYTNKKNIFIFFLISGQSMHIHTVILVRLDALNTHTQNWFLKLF